MCFEHFLSISNLQFKVKTDVICCATVRCCSKFKQQSGDRIRWDSDGPNGVNTTPNSQSIILDWWTTGNNYHLFHGGKDDGGKTSGNKKNMVWQMLSEEIKKKGIIVEQTAHHVGMKINKMEAEYRKTNDWINQTGQGIIDEGGDITNIVNKRCSYFYLLEPIMADRPGTNPLMVSEAGIDNGTEVDDVDTISSTSIQLAGGDKSIALVDELPVKEVAVTNAVPANFIQRKKVDVEVEKSKKEAELIEEQKKTVMQDRLKKLLLDRKELLELGVSREEVDLVLPLAK